MNTSKMPGDLVFLHITDASQSMHTFQDGLPQGRIGKGTGGVCDIAPGRIGRLVRFCRSGQQKFGRIQADKTIGELMLDSLEMADELTELLAHLRMLHGQIERTAGRSIGSRHAAKAGKRDQVPQSYPVGEK